MEDHVYWGHKPVTSFSLYQTFPLVVLTQTVVCRSGLVTADGEAVDSASEGFPPRVAHEDHEAQ